MVMFYQFHSFQWKPLQIYLFTLQNNGTNLTDWNLLLHTYASADNLAKIV